MLTSIYLRNFVIVREAELGLRGGMTAITGETGAGKSILIDALGLALGERTSSDVIRHGEEQAEIITSFELADCPAAVAWLGEQELDSEQDCILRRVIRRNGPSRGFINGRPVAMQQLQQLGDLLVDIHGQHEHQSLMRLDSQREVLDSVAGNQQLLQKLASRYEDIQDCQQQIEQLRNLDGQGDSQLELLRYQVKELEQLALEENEIEALEEEHRRLANSSDLISGISENLLSLDNNSDTDIEQQLNQTISRLQQLERFDPALAEINQILLNASINIDEASQRLRQYVEKMDTNPQRLEWVNQRLGTIHDLARKHRISSSELPAQLSTLQQQLHDLEYGEVDELAALQAKYSKLAQQVSTLRKQAAEKLSTEVTERMQTLGMEGGRFSIAVDKTSDEIFRRHGQDRVEYLVAANPGQPAQPLHKVASGGELSRIALALQVCVMEASTTPTLIFDEVDVGIGGRVAEIVGQQMARLGSIRQVLCITHLAQVAANAHQQILISKSGDPVEASIAPLQDSERVEEIARMMGGIEITAQTRAHAEEMLRQSNG